MLSTDSKTHILQCNIAADLDKALPGLYLKH